MRKLLIVSALLFASALPAFAQRAPMPWPMVELYTNQGRPCSGCRLWSYVGGTTTELATFADANGVGYNTNPIILNSAGRASVWLAGRSYKFILEDSSCPYRDAYGRCHGAVIWTQDNVIDWGLYLYSQGTTVTTGTQSFSGAKTFSGTITAESLLIAKLFALRPYDLGSVSGQVTLNGSLSSHFRAQLNSSLELMTPTNLTDGQRLTLELEQPSTGNCLITLSSTWDAGDLAPITLSTAGSAIDVLECVYNAVERKIFILNFRKGY